MIIQARNHLKFALDSFSLTLPDLQNLSHLSTDIVIHHLLFVLALLNHAVLGGCMVRVLGSFLSTDFSLKSQNNFCGWNNPVNFFNRIGYT